ncbi:MAG: PAS domain-containing protein [Desulfobacteraceae bacterium]|nr:PAS domain-containing protein [Desulfobacteraceae bacterium]
MEAKILALNTGPQTADLLQRVITDSGYAFFTAAAAEKDLDGPFPCEPDLLVLESSGSGAAEIGWIEAVKKRFPDAQVAVLADEPDLKQTMMRLKDRADEFLAKPVDPTHLEIVLTRTQKAAARKARIKQLESTPSREDPSQISGLLETERFIIVKQLVDKMSHFIGQIARDVDDGVHYFHSTPYFVAIHDCDLKVVANNTTYQEYFGNRVGASSWDIYHGKAAEPDNCPVWRTVETGMVQRNKAVVKYAGGKKAPVVVHTAPIYNNHGKMELVLEVAAGSKEIRQLRKELRTTQQKYQKLFDEVPDYIAVLDRKFRITAINRRFQEEFGDRTGGSFFDIFSKKTFSENDCPLAQTLDDGKARHVETELLTRDNRKFNVMLSTAAVHDIGSHVFQIIVIFKDVTKLRRLEDNLSTLGLMFSVISHNIKGILTGLDAGLYHIDYGFYKNVPGRIEEGLEVATLMTERIRKLVLDVLYYAKPRELEVQRVDIAELADDVCRQVWPKMGARDIAFVCDVDPEPGTFEADRDIFRSVLINLLENAMEACMDPHLERELQVCFSVSRQGDNVRFAITDNGPGMDAEQKDQIFSKFYSTKGSRGTGLGLFIAQKVVAQHGGQIHVESEPGEGTRFTVTMPAAAGANA